MRRAIVFRSRVLQERRAGRVHAARGALRSWHRRLLAGQGHPHAAAASTGVCSNIAHRNRCFRIRPLLDDLSALALTRYDGRALQRASLYASPYLDAHGEEDPYLQRGKPLYLSQLRYSAIQDIWRALALDSDSHTLHTARVAGEWY